MNKDQKIKHFEDVPLQTSRKNPFSLSNKAFYLFVEDLN